MKVLTLYYKFMNLYDFIDFEELKANINNTFFELYNIYDSRFGRQTRSTPRMSEPSGSSRLNQNMFLRAQNLMAEFDTCTEPVVTPADMSEFKMYLNYDFVRNMSQDERANINLCTWWRSQRKQHPVLSAMARDLLAVQVSSVPSERAFSAGKRVMTDKRKSTNKDTLEMCVCLKDWLDAEERIQGRKDSDSDGNSTEGTGSTMGSG